MILLKNNFRKKSSKSILGMLYKNIFSSWMGLKFPLCYRYANRAKNIKNKPKINEDPKDALLREFQEEIARLKAQLGGKGKSGKGRKRMKKLPNGNFQG